MTMIKSHFTLPTILKSLRKTALFGAGALALGLAFAEPASAEKAQGFVCKIKPRDNLGWIPEDFVIIPDPAGGQAVVYGPFIHSVHEKPISASLKQVRNGQYQVRWRLDLDSIGRNNVRTNYEALFDPKSNSITIRARFPNENFANKPSGKGTCVSRKL